MGFICRINNFTIVGTRWDYPFTIYIKYVLHNMFCAACELLRKEQNRLPASIKQKKPNQSFYREEKNGKYAQAFNMISGFTIHTVKLAL
tara:strand:+ start:1131 stop:1397 length:267 start_codon:yes stop_codon:yes gene_type:complete